MLTIPFNYNKSELEKGRRGGRRKETKIEVMCDGERKKLFPRLFPTIHALIGLCPRGALLTL